MYPVLKYEGVNIRLKRTGLTEVHIFDNVRKKWLLLTPEEWVRQHVVSYLVYNRKYPSSFISLEKEIELNGTRKRYDIVVYDKRMKPFVIVECKAFDVTLNNEVMEQAMRYNLVLRVPYVMLTNGANELVVKNGIPVQELPVFTESEFTSADE